MFRLAINFILGGALALLDAVYLPLHLPSEITVEAMTFGMPRVGNQAFADLVDSRLPGKVNRVTSRSDPVPILPGRFLGFRHTSGETHILEDGRFVKCEGQDSSNDLCLTGEVKDVFFDSDVEDHSGEHLNI